MIYITGDTHGEVGRFAELAAAGELTWGEGDYLIICGDFGYLFNNSVPEYMFLNELSQKPYTICFVDGNHENFPAIYKYPCETWNGGRVHRIRDNIFHLMRGQVFTIDGKKIFTMGGAYSIDRYMRFEGRSWWQEELPSNAEYREAAIALAEHDHKVDYIITHTAPREIIRMLGKFPDVHDAELTGFLEWIAHEVEFKHWFFGHWHTDRAVTEKFRAIWFDVEKIV